MRHRGVADYLAVLYELDLDQRKDSEEIPEAVSVSVSLGCYSAVRFKER